MEVSLSGIGESWRQIGLSRHERAKILDIFLRFRKGRLTDPSILPIYWIKEDDKKLRMECLFFKAIFEILYDKVDKRLVVLSAHYAPIGERRAALSAMKDGSSRNFISRRDIHFNLSLTVDRDPYNVV